MWSYTPNYSPLHCSPCPVHVLYITEEVSNEYFAYMAPQAPRAPRMRTRPLPSHSTVIQLPPMPTFPFDFTSEFMPMTRSKLASTTVPLSTAIHIHDPTSHIGEVHVDQGIRTALEAIRYVQAIVDQPLSISTYLDLSRTMKALVQQSFLIRTSSDMGRNYMGQVWNMFLGGHSHPEGPKGADLLLGNTAVWGLDIGTTPGVCYLRVG
ncbi:hypothetical protein FPV67DRAFT_1116878 [Lyophyllum atratum]|nr:hypothetical protein FPV67DRAFT_1116878 [Lyophyllum atratum]